jgi:chromosome segregation ATPase
MSPTFRSKLGDYAPSSDANITVLHDLQRNLMKELNQVPNPKTVRNPAAAQRGAENGDIVSQLETLVELVESSQNVIDVLAGRIKTYEELIYDMKGKLCEESAQKEAAYQHAARIEVEFRAQTERVDAAEARAKAAEDEVKRLESREADVRRYLARLTTVVSNLAATSDGKSPILAMAS